MIYMRIDSIMMKKNLLTFFIPERRTYWNNNIVARVGLSIKKIHRRERKRKDKKEKFLKNEKQINKLPSSLLPNNWLQTSLSLTIYNNLLSHSIIPPPHKHKTYRYWQQFIQHMSNRIYSNDLSIASIENLCCVVVDARRWKGSIQMKLLMLLFIAYLRHIHRRTNSILWNV
jgi:hypothetical protein